MNVLSKRYLLVSVGLLLSMPLLIAPHTAIAGPATPALVFVSSIVLGLPTILLGMFWVGAPQKSDTGRFATVGPTLFGSLGCATLVIGHDHSAMRLLVVGLLLVALSGPPAARSLIDDYRRSGKG